VIKIMPKNWFSWNFSIYENNQEYTELNISTFREKGEFSIGTNNYTVFRKGLLHTEIFLENSGNTIATAYKTSAFKRSFNISYNSENYNLDASSAFRRSFIISKENQVIGKIKAISAFTRRAKVDFYAELPVELKTFIIWLTLLLWKREDDSGARAM
jgi:hypothetical protein